MKSKISWNRVASSNLASSSIKSTEPFGSEGFIFADRFEDLNVTRTSVAGEGLTEPFYDFTNLLAAPISYLLL